MLATRRILSGSGCALVIALGLSSCARAEDFDKITITKPDAKTTVYKIEQPNVTQRLTEYKSITFQPGDTITVSAGGCCQTGGLGKTWKRYVDPQGPNSDRLYYGLIWIPGATAPMVRLQGVNEKTVQIPLNTPTANLFLRLGYIDDNYGDNGYTGRDDGTGDQCKGLGNAFVHLTVKKGVPPFTPVVAPLDLVWTTVDDNFIPKNPKWGAQQTSLAAPDTDQLGGTFKLSGNGVALGTPPFTTQAPTIDKPGGITHFLCDDFGHAGGINGHLNWMPVTYEGTLRFDGHSEPPSDDDYNFRLIPTVGQPGLGKNNNGSFELEFDSDETIDHFHTPWWDAFHKAVDKDFVVPHIGTDIGDGGKAARALVDGSFAIVTGLFGLDCEHSSSSELHPVWAMAIRLPAPPSQTEEVWPMFVRNWGDEGFCSQDQHYLDLLNNTYTFRLPWRPGATSVTVKPSTVFQTNNAQARGPDVSFSPGHGVLVRFTLPKPEAQAMISGELHLEWAGSALKPHLQVADRPPPAPPSSAVKTPNPEKHLRDLLSKVTPAERTTYQKEWANLKSASKRPGTDNLALQGTPNAKLLPELLAHDLHQHAPPVVRAVHDAGKEAKDKARLEALHRVLGDKMPLGPTGDKPPAKKPPGSPPE